MIFFIYGEDVYRSRQKVNLIKTRFLEKDKSRMNMISLDGSNIVYGDLKKEFTTMPFLHDKKLIVVNNLLSKNKQTELFDELNTLIKSKKIPDFVFIVFYEEGSPDKRKAIFKTLQKEAQVEEFKIFEGVQINNWIKKEVQKRGGEINQDAINLLATMLGSDLWQISNELEKLLAFNKKISVDTVNLLVNACVGDSIFKLMDAISVKDKKTALKLLKQQLDDVGSDINYLLSMFVRQFRILIQVKSYFEEKSTSKQQAATELKLHPFVVQKTMTQASNFTNEQLLSIYKNLMDIEYKMKTSKADPATLLNLLIAQI